MGKKNLGISIYLWLRRSKKTVPPHLFEQNLAPYLCEESVPPELFEKTVAPYLFEKTVPPSFFEQAVPPYLFLFLHIYFLAIQISWEEKRMKKNSQEYRGRAAAAVKRGNCSSTFI